MSFQYAILFDLDGTLVDSIGDITQAINIVRKINKLEALPVEEIRKHVGKGAEPLAQACFAELLDKMSAKDLLLQFRHVYLQPPALLGKPYPTVLETLQKISRNPKIALAICTNKSTPAAEKTLKDYLPGIEFVEIAGPEKVTERKPSPKHLLEVLARINVKPENAWFLGDDQVDLVSAREANVPFLAVDYGFGNILESKDLNREQLISKFEDLYDFIPFLSNA